jgi:hypothetical protein
VFLHKETPIAAFLNGESCRQKAKYADFIFPVIKA